LEVPNYGRPLKPNKTKSSMRGDRRRLQGLKREATLWLSLTWIGPLDRRRDRISRHQQREMRGFSISLGLLTFLPKPPAEPDGKHRQPCKPAVNKNSVPLAYESRQPLVQASFYQPTMDMKRVKTVLNV